MPKVIFTYKEDDRDEYGEDVCLEFVFNEEQEDIYKMHELCTRFMSALGYADKSIEEVFGETI